MGCPSLCLPTSEAMLHQVLFPLSVSGISFQERRRPPSSPCPYMCTLLSVHSTNQAILSVIKKKKKSKLAWNICDTPVLRKANVIFLFNNFCSERCAREGRETCDTHTHTHTYSVTRCFGLTLKPLGPFYWKFLRMSYSGNILGERGKGWAVCERPAVCGG